MAGLRDALETLRGRTLLPKPIRTRFAGKFFAVVLLVIVVTAGVGTYNYAAATDTVEGQIRDQLSSTAQLQADGLHEWITNLRLQTRTLSEAEAFRDESDGGVSDYLGEQVSAYPDEVVAIHYVDLDSLTVRASSTEQSVGTDLQKTEVPWAVNSMSFWLSSPDNVYISSSYGSLVTDERVVAFVSAVPGSPDRAVVVTATLSEQADGLHQTVDGGYTRVLNADGGTVLRTGTGSQDAASINESAIVTDGANERNSGFVAGDDALAAYAPVERTDWVVVTYAPKSSAYAVRDQIATSLLSTVLAAVVVFGVVTTVFGRRTSRSLRELAETAQSMEDGDLDVELDTERDDEVGRLYAAFDAMRVSIREKIRDAEEARSAAEDARTEAERERREAQRAKREASELNERLEATAGRYREVMEACADGDLTRRLDEGVESDAMAEVAVAFNQMLDELDETLRRVRSFSDDVAETSERVTDRADEVRSASEAVSGSVREISDATDEQDRRLQEAAAEMNDLSATVEEISSATDEVAEQAESAAETGETGREAANRALAELDAIEDDVDATVEAVERLDEGMADIESVVGLITDIAEQTHVLALNASIEAARAGEAGSGFAVVAEEVKALAEQTQDATEEINESIDHLRTQTDATATEIRETQASVAAGAETVGTAMSSLEDVVTAVERTNAGLQEISDATESQAESASEVVAMVDEVAAIGEETAAGADDAASAAEQQTSSLAGVADDADDLSERADRLRDLLGEFTVTSSDATGESSASDPSDRGHAETPSGD
ncbi:methyl-accepting chemotaxis protein [Halorussus lipolyticus]|uniref:methyl-accepting chemotaxis protein n=1 Tax=Halorussus lipolyticus TaxID=3034024 RepID=UPI0023E870CB|nr:methyl-accepting chemotaxis protein [Halorussus sp. DT80]